MQSNNKKARFTPLPPTEEEEEPKLGVQGFLQLFRVKINGVHYILFGPPITLGDPKTHTETLTIEEFQIHEIVHAEPLLKSIIRAMNKDGTPAKNTNLQ